MAKKLQEMLTEIATKQNRVSELFDVADTRPDASNTKEEIKEIKTLNQELESLEKEAAEIKSLEDIRRGNDQRRKDNNTPANGLPHQGGSNHQSAQHGVKTVGQHILDMPEMAAFLKQFEGRPALGSTTIQSPRVQVPNYFSAKTLITGASDTAAGALVFNDVKPGPDPFYARPLTIKDLITVGETNSDTVEYVRVTGVTNNAAPVAEATATSGSSGTKPESALALAKVTEAVKTIAHWIPASNRALSDAPQIRTLIDNFLRYGLDEEVEDQIVSGDGTGENFTGILVVSNTTAQAFSTNILETTRKGRTKVRTTGRARPTAYVMNPLDWEKVDLLQDNEARYYFGGPRDVGQPRLWGLPVVESEAMPEGTAVVADWRLAVLWDRMQTAISVSNSHSDFFIRNLVAILAEMRAAFGVLRPQAFVICDLTA